MQVLLELIEFCSKKSYCTSKILFYKRITIKNLFNFELWLWCIAPLPCSIVLSLLREILKYLIFSLNYGIGPHWPFWTIKLSEWPDTGACPDRLVWQGGCGLVRPSLLVSFERLGSYLASNFVILAESYGLGSPPNLGSNWLGPSNFPILCSNFWKPWFVELVGKLAFVVGCE